MVCEGSAARGSRGQIQSISKGGAGFFFSFFSSSFLQGQMPPSQRFSKGNTTHSIIPRRAKTCSV
jgi:hypothetical protein